MSAADSVPVDPEEALMDAARLQQLLDQYAVELMADDLDHDSWVVVVWSKGKNEGDAEVAHGPYSTAVEALEKADTLRQQMENAEGRNTFMAGYTPDFQVLPVFGDDDEEST